MQKQRQIQRGAKGARAPSDLKLPNSLKIEIIGFCLTTSSHKSNFHANHAHHTHNAQNWSVEPLSDIRLDPQLKKVFGSPILTAAMFSIAYTRGVLRTGSYVIIVRAQFLGYSQSEGWALLIYQSLEHVGECVYGWIEIPKLEFHLLSSLEIQNRVGK